MGAGSSKAKWGGGRLSVADVERLRRRFQRMSGSQGGAVRIEQFQGMVELGANPFISRIFQLFDANKDGSITLDEFTKAIEYFGNLEDEEEQYRFAFRIFDMDDDGFIGSEELYGLLRTLVGQHYTEAQLEQVVHNTVTEFDADGDNRLDYAEFKQLLSVTDLGNKLQLAL